MVAATLSSPNSPGTSSPGTNAPFTGEELLDHGVVSAGMLHERLKALHRAGNGVRLEFLELLLALKALPQNLRDLGSPDIASYCDREFGLSRSTTFEYLRVGRALERLPRLRSVFGEGDLSWQQLREITRVATAKTELQWIELAWNVRVRELIAEVREAARAGRDRPREKRNGLPNLIAAISVAVTLEERQRILTAFRIVSEALNAEEEEDSEAPGGRERDPRPSLLRWADGILAGAIPAGPPVPAGQDPVPAGQAPGSVPAAGRLTPAQTILYRCCPECRTAVVSTDDGPVEVAPGRIDELAPVSNRVHISPEEELCAAEEEQAAGRLPEGERDAPNSPRLARQVIHRDDLRCAHCDSRHDLHAHHIVYRSEGGRTILSNEVTVCARCHALIHNGLLEVRGTIESGLEWTPRPWTPGTRVRTAAWVAARVEELLKRPVPLPPQDDAAVDHPAGPPCQGRSRESSGPDESTYVDSDSAGRVDALAGALVRLGFSRKAAKQQILAAITEVEADGPPADDERILRRALSGGPPRAAVG